MNSFEKLKTKLAELFQLDQADLDFGIYRIMNARRDEITRFLERDLLPQVRKAFGEYKSSDKAEIQKELDKVARSVKAAGMDPEQAPKVKELRARLAEEAVDVTALENEVYDHLCSFFSRYYDEGDFISLRRYKKGVYAIPYEGEEVKLHWANHDQYYIKTTEYFRDYAFKTPSGHRVHFKIAEADTEKDNIKAVGGNDRRFIYRDLTTKGTKSTKKEELEIYFEYRSDESKKKQDALNKEAVEKINEKLSALNSEWLTWISTKTPTEKNPDRTILEKHLSDYTKRNTFDYFIHKDLEGFLRRELDFYIKNEVMRLDDIEEESAPRVEQYLSKIKVIRRIAHKIIDFLAQIENFQKKLWLKKKFVVETNYCVTLDRVPEELYPEIAANDAQREEWVRLFAIDEIGTTKDTKNEKQESLFSVDKVVKYSEPLTVEFLKANDKLVLDTKFFGQEFEARLIASIDYFDERCDGVLIHAENFQTINFVNNKFAKAVDCIYIDPPYNTDAAPIIYKNGYKASSWISLLFDRLRGALPMLGDKGILCATIDDFQQKELHAVIEEIYGLDSILGTVVIRNNPSGRPIPTGFAIAHEYAIFASPNERLKIDKLPRDEKHNQRYKEIDELGNFMWELLRKRGSNSRREDAKRSYFPFFVSESIRLPKLKWDEDKELWQVLEESLPGEEVVYPIDENGVERNWRWGLDTAKSNVSELKFERKNGHIIIYYKFRQPEGITPTTNWIDSRYSATEHGTGLVKNFFKEYQPFSYPKSIYAVEDCISVAGMKINRKGLCLDYFAGSGTTGHAVINLNREDGGRRKYILVEMGDYFDTVLKPRIQKVIYSENWKDGKPVPTTKGTNKQENNFRDFSVFRGSSHMFKYIRLESYEDALANIELQRSKDQQRLLFPEQEPSVISVSSVANSFRESYMLKYLLDVESRGSQTLLNIDNFDDPWNYKLLVGAGSVGETKPVNADLVETFNWLLGLKVRHMDRISGFQVVEGENPNGEKVLVIWRKVRDLTTKDTKSTKEIALEKEQANRDLEAFFTKQQYNTLDSEFDVIYVNGDNNLMNIPLDPDKAGVEPRYKVRLIEEEFKRLMFDVQGI